MDFSTSSVKSYWLLPKLAVLVKFILLEKAAGVKPNLNFSPVCNMTCSFITEQQNNGFAYFPACLLMSGTHSAVVFHVRETKKWKHENHYLKAYVVVTLPN